MSDRSLQFTRLHVERVPGVPREGQFSLDDLSPGVNVILGPNGAGKTISGRALMALLWPRESDLARATISGTWMLEGRRWHVDIDAGHPTWRCEGAPAEPPALPPSECRPAHWLGLRELLMDDGPEAGSTARFAARIAREMMGGYDLDAAARGLQWTATPRRPDKERRAVSQRRDELLEVQAEARRRHEESESLEQLESQHREAAAAGDREQRIDHAIALLEAENELATRQAVVEAADPRLARLRGDERTRLDELHQHRTRRDAEQREAAERLARAEAAATATGLPAGGVPAQRLTAIGEDVRELQEAERAERDAASVLATAAAARDQRRAAIGTAVDEAALSRLGSVAPDELVELADAEARLRADGEVVAARRRQVEAEVATSDAGASEERGRALGRACDALGHWLATPAPPTPAAGRTRWSWPLLLAAAAVAFLAVALGILVAAAWSVAVLLAVIFAWLARPMRPGGRPGGGSGAGPAAEGTAGTGDDPRAARRADFERLAVATVEDWTVDGVRLAMDVVLAELAECERMATRRAAARERLSELEAEEAALAERRHRLAEQREACTAAIGIDVPADPPASADDDAGHRWLHVLGTHLAAWQAAGAEVSAAAARRDDASAAIQALCDRLDRRLSVHATPPSANAGPDEVGRDAAWARGRLAALRERHDARRAADERLESAVRDRDRARDEIARLDEAIAALFAAAGVPAHADAELDRLLVSLEGYRADVDATRDAGSRVTACRSALGGEHPAPGADIARLTSMRAEAAALSAGFQELTARLAVIKERQQEAGRGRSVEQSMQALEDARGTLLAARTTAESSVVGDALVGWLRADAAERTRPEVLRRAADLFARITHHRYELRLSAASGAEAATDAEAATFVAYDHRDDLVKRLDELSAGERVQLLLSVRLGFVEQGEDGLRLPIVLDEILGTTDDGRAAAIIDAVAEIAREGRQVFYLTAQRDEVGKWRARLGDDPSIDLRLVDLATIRRLAEADLAPLPIEPPAEPVAPPPGSLNHAAYGRALDVPGLQPAAGSGSVHLWHVLDDPGMLHAALEHRVRELGPFLRLVEAGAGSVLGVPTPDLAGSIAARRRALDAAFEAWRVGRGRPVDRAALVDSGAVSSTFIEPVVALAAECGGDAAAILAALESKAVSNWRAEKTDQLRRFLEEQGHLDPEPALGREDIHHRVLPRVAEDLEAGRLDRAWLSTMIARLPGVPEGSGQSAPPVTDTDAAMQTDTQTDTQADSRTDTGPGGREDPEVLSPASG